jgi:hypothetical protein
MQGLAISESAVIQPHYDQSAASNGSKIQSE